MLQQKFYTLFELNTHIKRVMALNFESELWVKAEILSAKLKNGHLHVELVQKDLDSNDIIAQIRATVWSTDFARIRKKNPDLDSYFTAGFETMCYAIPIFHEKYGLSLKITDIDTAYTIGAIELRKEALFKQIRDEGLDQINTKLPLPLTFQRLAIISSESAAGYADFTKHLKENGLQLRFQTTLFDSIMQGNNLESSISDSLHSIEQQKDLFDAVIIIRGGGSKVDLATFDSYTLAYKIAHFPLPVITGIGHEIDFSAMDLTAAISVKTPTAVAEFLIKQNSDFLYQIMEIHRNTLISAKQRLINFGFILKQQFSNIHFSSINLIQKHRFAVEYSIGQIKVKVNSKIHQSRFQINLLFQKIELANPLAILAKGYTLVFQKNKKITTCKDFNEKEETTIYWDDGKAIGTFKYNINGKTKK